jgi:hypothetical protein
MASVSFMPSARWGSEYVDAALEASCDVLMVLQSLRTNDADASMGDSGEVMHVQRAIESVRQTIEELRLARRGVCSVTALGFVMAMPRSRRSGRTAGELAACKSAGCSPV